jgi:hypothetical protein
MVDLRLEGVIDDNFITTVHQSVDQVGPDETSSPGDQDAHARTSEAV